MGENEYTVEDDEDFFMVKHEDGMMYEAMVDPARSEWVITGTHTEKVRLHMPGCVKEKLDMIEYVFAQLGIIEETDVQPYKVEY